MAERQLPNKNGVQIELTPPFVALAQTSDSTISASTEITLNVDTTVLEVNSLGGVIFLKYGTDAVTNANFDEVILDGGTRHYVVPTGVTAINLIDNGDGASVIVIEK